MLRILAFAFVTQGKAYYLSIITHIEIHIVDACTNISVYWKVYENY